jgi:hypothetical protein
LRLRQGQVLLGLAGLGVGALADLAPVVDVTFPQLVCFLWTLRFATLDHEIESIVTATLAAARPGAAG